MTKEERKREYAEMTPEELERRLGETFFCPDQIDETVFRELEALLEALDEKQPLEEDPDPEAGWQRFLTDRAEELAECFVPDVPVPAGQEKNRYAAGPAEKGRRSRAPLRAGVLRRALIAAAVVVLLAGAALAADSLGLWAWAPRWNASAGRYEPAAMEFSGESPIREALAELAITEPVYPAKLPEGFVLTESHISKDPLLLTERYARGDRVFSVTITPIRGVKTAVYQPGGAAPRTLGSGKDVYYAFENEEVITVVWLGKDYATTLSGNLPLAELEEVIDSLGEETKGGPQP